VHLRGVHLMGMHLISVYLTGDSHIPHTAALQ